MIWYECWLRASILFCSIQSVQHSCCSGCTSLLRATLVSCNMNCKVHFLFGSYSIEQDLFSMSSLNFRASSAKNIISLLGKHSSNSDLDHWMCSTFLFLCRWLSSASSHAPFMIHFIGYAFFDISEAEGFRFSNRNDRVAITHLHDSLSKRWSFTKLRSNVLVPICINWLISTLI